VQALIRTIDPETGLVGLRKLEETPFYDLLDGISFLKAARNEACYLDLETVRQKTVVIVTEGKHGSRVYSKDREYRVPAFPATEVDPTGAGDSFLAGFSAGLYQGLPVEQAVLMGNYFGGLAVGQVGVPHFTENQLQVLTFTPCLLVSCGPCGPVIYLRTPCTGIMEEFGYSTPSSHVSLQGVDWVMLFFVV
jgi:1D-myo-inositol 3-kinase